MAYIYYDLIMNGFWSLDNVPNYWYADVIKMLEEGGYFND